MAIRDMDQKAQVNQQYGTADESANAAKANKIFDPADQPQTYTGKKGFQGNPSGNRAPGEQFKQKSQVYNDGTAAPDATVTRAF